MSRSSRTSPAPGRSARPESPSETPTRPLAGQGVPTLLTRTMSLALLVAWLPTGEVRAGWTERLEGFPDDLLDRVVFRHAMVGLMGLPHTLDFLQSHLNHHARQVERLLR